MDLPPAACADAVWTLRDSAANTINTGTIASGGSANIDAPDGEVTGRNSNGDSLGSVDVRSNGTAFLDIADSAITRPDGSTVGLPASLPLDVREYRSGITYNFGRILHSGQVASPYRTGDESSMWADGFFSYTRPVYTERHAELGADFVTLAGNNMYGNTLRFTARDSGAAAPTSGNRWIRDHFLGVDIYVLGTLLTGNWNTAIDSGITLRTTLGEGGIYHVNDRILDQITDGAIASPLNYAPFNIALGGSFWTSTTNAAATANAFFLTTQGGFGNGVSKATSQLYGIYVKRFA
jgi:hypothetical protein